MAAWQTYDSALIGRQLTVVLNETTIIEQQDILGITGGALDSHEQGDHGEVAFWNIILKPANSTPPAVRPQRLLPSNAR